jgi:Fe-S-cluster containining protein
MCCKVLGITELQKPVGKWCPHCKIGKGCQIYETRPQECRTFHCAWLVDNRFSDIWRPDRSKIVITTGQDGRSNVRMASVTLETIDDWRRKQAPCPAAPKPSAAWSIWG